MPEEGIEPTPLFPGTGFCVHLNAPFCPRNEIDCNEIRPISSIFFYTITIALNKVRIYGPFFHFFFYLCKRPGEKIMAINPHV